MRGKEEGKDEAKGDGQELTVTTSPAASSQFAIRVEPYLNKQNINTKKLEKREEGVNGRGV